ncbi:MAG TPA: tetratricopeptide repeat protein [Thermoanaerobaculia bacterium]|nr:tetratricopeptide repeat protein [Thermoanaerobaculia bacterium]
MKSLDRSCSKGYRPHAVRPYTCSLLALVVTLSLASCITMRPPRQSPSATALEVPDVPLVRFGDDTCGAGALQAVLNHFGDPVTQSELDKILPKSKHGGVLSIDLLLEARKRGFDAKISKGNFDDLLATVTEKTPAILMLRVINGPGRAIDFFHYVVLDGIDPAGRLLRMQFGDGDRRWVSLEKLTPLWSPTDNTTIVIRPRGAGRVDVSDRMRQAVALESEGKNREAATIYESITRDQPALALAWTNLGNVRSTMGQKREAEAAYREALVLDPNDRDTLNNLAWLLHEAGRDEESEPLAAHAAALPGLDSYLVLETLAQIQSSRHECDAARQTFERARGEVPDEKASYRATIDAELLGIRDCK